MPAAVVISQGMVNGTPSCRVRMPFIRQPPTIWFTERGVEESSGLPLPKGSSYVPLR